MANQFIKFPIRQYIEDYLVGDVRNQLNIDYLYSISKPIVDRYNDVLILRDNDLFDTQHNGQILSFEHFLNNKIDTETGEKLLLQKAFITDTGNIPQYYIGTDEEVVQNIFDIYDYESNQILYNPTNPYIGEDSEVAEPEYELWVNAKQYEGDFVDFVINIHPADFTPDKLEKITFYADRYKLAGMSYQIITY